MKTKLLVLNVIFFAGLIGYIAYLQKQSNNSMQEANLELLVLQLGHQEYHIKTLSKEILSLENKLSGKNLSQAAASLMPELNLIVNSNDKVTEARWRLLEAGLKSLRDEFNRDTFAKEALDLMEQEKKIKKDLKNLRSKL